MHDSSDLTALAGGFLLVLTRITAFFAFIPIPGSKAFVDMPKAVLTVLVTLMLFRFWPAPASGHDWSTPEMLADLGSEAMLGLAVGVGMALVIEAMQFTGQFLALQAGFSYATTIDPNSQVDSGILLILFQLLTSLIVFGAGLDRQILTGLARSFERIPAGSFRLTPAATLGIAGIGSQMIQIGFRLALPVIAVLLVTEFALVLVGKIEQHMQLSHLLFSMKTLVSLAILAILLPGLARLIEQWLGNGWRAVQSLVGL